MCADRTCPINLRAKPNLCEFLDRELRHNNEIRTEIRRYFDINLELAKSDGGLDVLNPNFNRAVACLRNIEVLLAEFESLEVLSQLTKI